MLFSYENLYRQYLLCRRHKRNTANALKFEVRQEQNLLELQLALTSRSYSPSRSVCFFVRKPKLREVFAADFRDRVVHLEATVASYLGHFRRAGTHRLCQKLWARHAFLGEYLALDADLPAAAHRPVLRRDFRRVGQQYAHFRDLFPQDAVFMQVGAFVEFYAPDPRQLVGTGLGLKALRPTRRGARHGFPVGQLVRRIRGVLAAGWSAVVVAETGRNMSRLCERAVHWRYVAHGCPTDWLVAKDERGDALRY